MLLIQMSLSQKKEFRNESCTDGYFLVNDTCQKCKQENCKVWADECQEWWIDFIRKKEKTFAVINTLIYSLIMQNVKKWMFKIWK